LINTSDVTLRDVLVNCQPNPDVRFPGDGYALVTTFPVLRKDVYAKGCQ